MSSLTPSDCKELAKIVEKSRAKWLEIDKNSPDTVKRLCELCPGVTVRVQLNLDKNSLDTVSVE